ncbi:hypothetical protein IAR50_005769 [Cryptococcus sp. DSM 104548]
MSEVSIQSQQSNASIRDAILDEDPNLYTQGERDEIANTCGNTYATKTTEESVAPEHSHVDGPLMAAAVLPDPRLECLHGLRG